MIIVENKTVLTELYLKIHSSDSIVLPIFSNSRNYSYSPINSPLLLYIYLIKSGIGYIIPINTDDCINITENDLDELLLNIFDNTTNKFTTNLDSLLFFKNIDDRCIDIRVLEYISSGKVTTQSNKLLPVYSFMNHLHYNLDIVNKIIPTTKHIEYLELETEKILSIINKYGNNTFELSFKMFNSTMMRVLNTIENNGICVTSEFPVKNNKYNDILYTSYSPFNLTSRPTCSSSKYSFNSISKTSIDRSYIISRFGLDGMLVMLDYNSYHLSLICELIDYKFSEYPYLQLGKIYFGKDELTDDEIKESKRLTFHLIYGGIPFEFKQIEFFNRVSKFTDELWSAFNSDGRIYTKIFKRRYEKLNFSDLNPQKLFNYYLQSFETENNMIIIDKINNFLKDYSSKIILYMYDSILIDFNMNDGKDVLLKILDLFKNNKYEISIYNGINYLNMIKTL